MTFKKTYWLALTKSRVDDTKVVDAFLYLNCSSNRSKQSAKTSHHLFYTTDILKVTFRQHCRLEPDLAGGWGASWGPPPGGERWWPREGFAGPAPCSPSVTQFYHLCICIHTSTDVNKTLPCSLSWGTGRTHLKHHHYVVWCSWFHVLMRQLTFNVVWGVSLKNLHADFASNGVTDQSELGGSWNQPLEQCNFVLYLGLQVVRGRWNTGTLVSINNDSSSWHGAGHNAGLNTFLTRKTEFQTPIVKIPFLFRIKWYW